MILALETVNSLLWFCQFIQHYMLSLINLKTNLLKSRIAGRRCHLASHFVS